MLAKRVALVLLLLALIISNKSTINAGLRNVAMLKVRDSLMATGWPLPLYQPIEIFAGTYPNLDDISSAEGLLESAWALNRDDNATKWALARLQTLRGDVALTEKHPSEAVIYYMHAAELEPGWWAVYRTLGRVYLIDIGKPTIALKYLDRALALDDTDCLSLYWRGETLVRLSPPRSFEGRESAKKLSTICPSRGSFAQLAEMHLRLNDWVAALQTYDVALAFSDTPDALPWIYYGMGRAYEGLGDPSMAERYWRMALVAGPSLELREELATRGIIHP